MIYRVIWDTPADATEFDSAAGDYVDSLATPAGLIPGDGKERWILFGSDEHTLHDIAAVLGLGS